MTMSDRATLSPVPLTIDNPEDWAGLNQQLSDGLGVPSGLSPELFSGVVASSVPLLFAADASGSMDLLRGAFTDPVIAQCQRNTGCLHGDTPESAVLHLVGTPMRDGKPVLRVHLTIMTRTPEGAGSANSQFWDFAVGASVTVGPASCPNCGAPLASGQLICDHCHTNVAQRVDAPLVVSRLELY